MLAEERVVAFVPTADGNRAREFYVDVLKLAFVEDDGFAIVVRANTNMIRLVRVGKYTAATYTILGWEVADIEKTAVELTAAGIVFMRNSFLEQDHQGIWTAPGGARVAWFQDPDGNVLSISQH